MEIKIMKQVFAKKPESEQRTHIGSGENSVRFLASPLSTKRALQGFL